MSGKKQKIFVVVVLVLVLLFGVGQFFAGANLNTANQTTQTTPPTSNTDAANPLATQVIDYMPSVPASSTPVEKGTCFASSVAAPYRTDAWRCTVGNAISDPCFEIPSSNDLAMNTPEPNLLCGANPASTDISSQFVLDLTKSLPPAQAPSGTVPSNWAWLVELTDGTICSPYTGTRPFTAAGDVAIYSCNGGPGESMIFGDLNNATSTWTAEVGSLSTSTKVFPPVIVASTTVPVFAVWQ